jgi:hypothetical protein
VAGVVTGTWPPSDLTVAPDDSPRGISAFRTLLKRSRSPGCAPIAFLALLANDIVIWFGAARLSNVAWRKSKLPNKRRQALDSLEKIAGDLREEDVARAGSGGRA